jgi:putative SOS response-associated peptidase YedK
VNADDHALMRNFHKPEDEKRMVVILREDQYDAWLSCDANAAVAFMKQYPADHLVATPDPERGRRTKSGDATGSEGL